MTREQAKREIDSLDFYLQNHTDDYGEESHTAMMMAIKALEQQTCEDAVSRREALLAISNLYPCAPRVNFFRQLDKWYEEYEPFLRCEQAIKELPSVQPEHKWIPIKWHTITDEEREREGYPKEWVNHIDCIMPEDGQEILITVKGHKGQRWVEKDTCCIDDGFYIDSGYDWVEDVEAWCELPQPYEPQESKPQESEG